VTRFPDGWRVETLTSAHDRASFRSGRTEVDDWLRRNARQQQEKHLSSTRVLLDDGGSVAGYFTLAVGHVDFSDLPPEEARKLPKRLLPAVTLAWLGVRQDLHGRGLGARLLAQALTDAHAASRTLPFVVVLIDALDAPTRAFYERYDVLPLPGHPLRMFLPYRTLDAMMGGSPL
jgi:predicted N-acetyltransferase YhbS